MQAIREAKEELFSSRRTLLADTWPGTNIRDRRLSLPTPQSRMRTTSSLAVAIADQAISQSTPRVSASVETLLNANTAAGESLDGGEEGREIPDDGLTTPAVDDEEEYERAVSVKDGQIGMSAGTKRHGLPVYHDYSAPVWQPDSKTDRCMRCSERFQVWRRRHHCRLCGDVVCWRCSTKVSPPGCAISRVPDT